jgi:hypothetical protein
MTTGTLQGSLVVTGQGSSVVRAPGGTHLTGTAVSDDGTYNVDVTR